MRPAFDQAGWSQPLRDALRALGPTQRQVLVLIYGQRMTQAEVATQLRLPVATISHQVAAALASVADRLTN